jgi:hypothetical protein
VSRFDLKKHCKTLRYRASLARAIKKISQNHAEPCKTLLGRRPRSALDGGQKSAKMFRLVPKRSAGHPTKLDAGLRGQGRGEGERGREGKGHVSLQTFRLVPTRFAGHPVTFDARRPVRESALVS